MKDAESAKIIQLLCSCYASGADAAVKTFREMVIFLAVVAGLVISFTIGGPLNTWWGWVLNFGGAFDFLWLAESHLQSQSMIATIRNEFSSVSSVVGGFELPLWIGPTI